LFADVCLLYLLHYLLLPGIGESFLENPCEASTERFVRAAGSPVDSGKLLGKILFPWNWRKLLLKSM